MTGNDDVRQTVSATYARAVTQPSKGKGCCSGPEQKGVTARLAGYDGEELAALPADAVANSFGCGNPVAFSEIREGDVVLDLGSGAGIDILLAGSKVGPSGYVIGVDMTEEMLAKARENIAASGLSNVEVRQGIIESLPVESGTVDWVISNCVINLSPEKDKVFAEIARVLKPGGRMLVSDIVVEELPECIRNSQALYCSCVAGAISEADYLAGLRAAGLADVAVRERFVYDLAQLGAFVQSELAEGGEPSGCCCSSRELDGDTLAAVISLAGKVWSAKIFARKPA
ncbi:MAG: arsenite methyltransferase [Armatimonadota bacterium]